MKKLFSLLLLASLSFKGFSQTLAKPAEDSIPDAKDYLINVPPPPSKVEDKTFGYAEVPPEYYGGPQAMNHLISSNLNYPVKARRKGIQGRVLLQFVIDKDGSVTDIVVQKGIGGGCDEEAVRLLNLMPKWKPGTQNGKPVKVLYMIPLTFKLSS